MWWMWTNVPNVYLQVMSFESCRANTHTRRTNCTTRTTKLVVDNIQPVMLCYTRTWSSKAKYTSICTALYRDLSLKRSGMARVNEGSHSFTCHSHVCPQVEWTIPAFIPQPQSITALWLVLISRPAEGRRMSWPGWLGEILRWFARRRRSPIPVLTAPDVE